MTEHEELPALELAFPGPERDRGVAGRPRGLPTRTSSGAKECAATWAALPPSTTKRSWSPSGSGWSSR